jgi:hypothetical protein
MDLEQQLRESYAERLRDLDLPAGDAAAARRTGARMRAGRRVAVGGTALAVIAVAVGGTLLGTDRISIGPSHSIGHWRELPAAPLSPRAYAESVWTGREVIVLGGETDPCPPNADCASPSEELRDGAAYDPATDTWRHIAEAPVSVGSGDRLLAAAGRVVLRHGRQQGSEWFVYDPASDEWFDIPSFAGGVGDLPSAIGDRVYGFVGDHVAVYNARRGLWTQLPPDPIVPKLAQRRVTATAYGPVVSGYDSTQPNDGREPSVVLADVWDGTSWRRLPATGQLDNNWFWTGTRMVDPDPTVVDGGEVDPFPHPYPSGGMLDPGTGEWRPLPDSISDSTGGWGLNAQGGRWSAVYGQVYDTDAGVAWRLPRPDDAPDIGTTAVWAGDDLLAFGGVSYGQDVSPDLTNRAWLWTP